jgi:hypothetical protein
MDAKEEEEVVHDDAAADDNDDKEDGATQKKSSNGLHATTGQTRSTCSFLGSLLRWSNKPQLKTSESSEPSTSKQKEDTPKLSDVQVTHNTPPRQIINVTAHACLTPSVRCQMCR